MLGFGWLTMRQAEDALKNGRLEEAQRLLSQPAAHGYKGSWEMLQQVARGFVARARQHLKADDPAAAWTDLTLAEKVGVTEAGVTTLRQDLIRHGIGEARAMLEAGEPDRAADILAALRGRGSRHTELDLLEEAAKHWSRGRELASRGEFGPAQQSLARATQLLPRTPTSLLRFQAELRERGRDFSDLLVQLHEAADRKEDRRVLQIAERVLAAAPQHMEARKARARAWKSIQPATIAGTPPVNQTLNEAAPAASSQRFLLWIDGIGGYLICLDPRVTLGQAVPDALVDVPLYADVSRMHAALNRDPEGYFVEAMRGVKVNGKPVEKAPLRSGDRLMLGGCELKFTMPVPVSTTAQLEVVSGHRLPQAVDKVFLMADTLVLGPTSQAHVFMPDLKQPIILYRNGDGLGLRYQANMTVDGEPCRGRANLQRKAHVAGEDWSLAIEPMDGKKGLGARG